VEGGRIHQFLWRRSRVASQSRNRNCAVRNDEKPFQAGSSNSGAFRAWANRGYPEGTRLLLRARTERKLLAVNKNAACTKDAERRTKGVCDSGKLGGSAGRIFRQAGDSEQGPLACEPKAT